MGKKSRLHLTNDIIGRRIPGSSLGYYSNGRVSHIVVNGEPRCDGPNPPFGTGFQSEYEIAEALPVCLRCINRSLLYLQDIETEINNLAQLTIWDTYRRTHKTRGST